MATAIHIKDIFTHQMQIDEGSAHLRKHLYLLVMFSQRSLLDRAPAILG